MSPGSSTFDYQESDDEFSLVSPACRSPGLNIACISRPYSRSCSVISVTFFSVTVSVILPVPKIGKTEYRAILQAGWTLVVGNTCGPLAAVSCLCRDTAVRCSVVGPILLPARRQGRSQEFDLGGYKF